MAEDTFRKVRISDIILDEWEDQGLTDPFGNHLSVEVGEEDDEGFVTLTFTRHTLPRSPNVEAWSPTADKPGP